MILSDLPYDCLNCGKCCQVLNVEIQPAEYQGLAASPVTEELVRAGFHPLRVTDSGRAYLGKETGGRCSYLSSETLCLLQTHTGYASKPQTCRDFPFHAVDTPEGVYLGLSFLCTAVARGHGTSLEKRRPELESRFPSGPTPDRWRLWADIEVDWPTYRTIEDRLRGRLQEAGPSGLVKGAARLAIAAREGRLDNLHESRTVSPLLGRALDTLLLSLLTFIESMGQSLERAAQVLLALQSGDSYASRVLEGVHISVGELDQEIPPWFAIEAQRYLDHLLFRKTLLRPPDILTRAALLPLVAQALVFFAQAQAQHHRRPMAKEDFYESVGVLEGRLMLHAQGMESYLSQIGEAFYRQVQE